MRPERSLIFTKMGSFKESQKRAPFHFSGMGTNAILKKNSTAGWIGHSRLIMMTTGINSFMPGLNILKVYRLKKTRKAIGRRFAKKLLIIIAWAFSGRACWKPRVVSQNSLRGGCIHYLTIL